MKERIKIKVRFLVKIYTRLKRKVRKEELKELNEIHNRIGIFVDTITYSEFMLSKSN